LITHTLTDPGVRFNPEGGNSRAAENVLTQPKRLRRELGD
jgi:hypothetical protein